VKAIETEVPAGKIVHVILDNYAAHRHPKIRPSLDRHERFVLEARRALKTTSYLQHRMLQFTTITYLL
jgi:hypothetical protein